MYLNLNLRDEHALVHPFVYQHLLLTGCVSASLVGERATGYELPAADAYAHRTAEAAEQWLAFARERSRMKDNTLVRKALHALAFSLRHRTHDLAVPTKLSGTGKHQPALWWLVRERVGFGTPLEVEEVTDGRHVQLVVSFEGEVLGEVQSRHVPWLRPLIPFGAGLYLVRVTGQETDYTLGLNVVIGHAGAAVAALQHALGVDAQGDGYGGERAAQAAVAASVATPPVLPETTGDGAATDAMVALDSEDVVLWRDERGTAYASVPHAVRHSPSGIEWGYTGSGPADLALSVLLAFADEVTAEALHVRFKDEVVAQLPHEGGVLRARAVRCWIEHASHAA